MNSEEIKQWIWSRCTDCGKCLLWDGAVTKGPRGGTPMARLPGAKTTQAARRLLLTVLGVDLEGKHATTTCGNPLCMAEAHVAAWTRKKLQKRSAQKLKTLAVATKHAAIRRQTAVLSMEKVREMRASGLSSPKAAKVYGCSERAAYAAIVGETWKEYGSPFGGGLAP